MIRVRDLTLSLGGREIVRGLSLNVSRGEVVLLVGHNGSGKSTLLRGLAGLIPPSRGSVEFGADSGSRKKPSILLQGENVFLDRTAIENIAVEVCGRFMLSRHSSERLEVGVVSAFPELKGKLKSRCSVLSGGMRQLVALSRALMSNSDVKLLDEPSIGLAEQIAPRVFGALRESLGSEGRCAIIVEHNFRALAPFADRLCIMKNGELVYDGSPDLILDQERFHELYL